MTDKQTPPDWVLIEAGKQSNYDELDLSQLRYEYNRYAYAFRALCDTLVELGWKPPVDYTDQALADQLRAFCPNDLRCYQGRDPVKIFRDGLARRGVELRRIEEIDND